MRPGSVGWKTDSERHTSCCRVCARNLSGRMKPQFERNYPNLTDDRVPRHSRLCRRNVPGGAFPFSAPRPNPGMTERYLGRAREHAQEAQQEPASHDHVKLRVTASRLRGACIELIKTPRFQAISPLLDSTFDVTARVTFGRALTTMRRPAHSMRACRLVETR
jgi:hypothetical protein